MCASWTRTGGCLAEDRDTDLGKRTKAREVEEQAVAFMGRRILVVDSPTGPLALADGKPINPKPVEKYLASKFGDNLDTVRADMTVLAKSRTPAALAREAFHLYENSRPTIPAGTAGWGAKGVLDTALMARLAKDGET